MPEPIWLVAVLVPLAAWAGWRLAARRYRQGNARQHRSISTNYFRGLNYLLNEQPDKAIEVFLKLAEVNSDTVETHLALGNLFRRRGEVDKAIHFHRHIMSRSNLGEQHRFQALLELGEDYMSAGLLDRAEKLFSELAADGRHSEISVRSLLSIYQQERDWKNVIIQARRLGQISGESPAVLIAQFHCEMAAEELDAGRVDGARHQLDAARSVQPECVRAHLMEADIAVTQSRWEDAARHYRSACELDPDIVLLIDDNLSRTFISLDREQALLEWLHSLVERGSNFGPALAYARVRARMEPQRAIRFLIDHLKKHPSARGLDHLLELMQRHDHGLGEIAPELMSDLVGGMVAEQPRFRCRQCGFSGQTWHWQCPSCRRWETTRPVGGELAQ